MTLFSKPLTLAQKSGSTLIGSHIGTDWYYDVMKSSGARNSTLLIREF